MATFDVTLRSSAEFIQAIRRAKHGDLIIYCIDKYCRGPHKHAAMDAYQSGLVSLVQKRHANGMFIYIAQRTIRKDNIKNERQLKPWTRMG